MNQAGRLLHRLAPWLLLGASLILLRMQLLEELKLDFGKAWDMGLGLGIYYDFGAAMIPVLLSWLLWGTAGLPRSLGFMAGALALWVVTWGNVVYLRHFKQPMDWWVLEYHRSDLLIVGGSIAQLGWNLLLGSSFLLLLLCYPLHRSWEKKKAKKRARWREEPPGFWNNRIKGTLAAIGLVPLFLAVLQIPRMLDLFADGHPMNSHILHLWYLQTVSKGPFGGLDPETLKDYGLQLERNTEVNPGTVLLRYRDFNEVDWTESVGGEPKRQIKELNGGNRPAGAGRPEARTAMILDGSNGGSEAKAALEGGSPASYENGSWPGGRWPLLQDFEPTPGETRKLRKRLGLPLEGPVNIIILLVEGLRWFEIGHPEIGPHVFPRLRELFAGNGLVFSQAYTSSFTAGQTVRGVFSISCSFLPNMAGPATYIAYPTTRARCLPSLLKENGYSTLWFNDFPSKFHNKRFFESRHGMEHFYDREFFDQKRAGGDADLAEYGDSAFLMLSLEQIVKMAGEREGALFAELSTISTHPPIAAIPGIHFEEEFEQALSGHPMYRDFLSMFRRTDEDLGLFFDQLFGSAIGDNTLVFLLADHANQTVPHLPLTPEQRFDASFRIPLALITKNMPKPERIDKVVHQIDLAPTAARIAGASGKTSWLGRGLFSPSGEGSPWLYYDKGRIYWRTATRACYAEKCFDMKGRDLLVDGDAPTLPPQPELDNFFRLTVEFAGKAIGSNLISPEN